MPSFPLLFLVIICDWLKLSAVGGAELRQEGKRKY
jgi:hypothetical protein